MPFHPHISGLYEGLLTGVTCVASWDCLAVGNVDAHTHVECPPNSIGLTVCETTIPVLERWDGANWAQQKSFPVPVVAQIAVPLASEQPYSRLDAVSCGSANACTLTGYMGANESMGPDFADSWNGTAWKMTILPAPPGIDPELTSISCTTQGRCVAVGSVKTGGTSRPYTAEETAGIWSLRQPPAIAGTAVLNSVSCVPDGQCVAVGHRGTGAASRPLIERWRLNRWTPETTQLPRGSRQRGGSELVGVSCTAAPAHHGAAAGIGSCAAAGNYGSTSTSGLSAAWFIDSLGPVLPLQTSS